MSNNISKIKTVLNRDQVERKEVAQKWAFSKNEAYNKTIARKQAAAAKIRRAKRSAKTAHRITNCQTREACVDALKAIVFVTAALHECFAFFFFFWRSFYTQGTN